MGADRRRGRVRIAGSPPDVAYDATATIALARRLHDRADFPNLLVKIPGTP
jgi:transaldolase